MHARYTQKMFETLGVLCLLLLAAWTPPRVVAQTLVSARVAHVSGEVEIQRANSSRTKFVRIALFDELQPGDQIRTGYQSRLVLELTDGSVAILGENTLVRLEEFNRSPKQLFHILKGRTRIHIEHFGGQPNPYQVTTPTAVIAVRGTKFDILVRNGKTDVFLNEGLVEVASRTKADQPVVLIPMHRTRVREGHLPELPRSFQHGENDREFEDRLNVARDPLRDRFEDHEGQREDRAREREDRARDRTSSAPSRSSRQGQNSGRRP